MRVTFVLADTHRTYIALTHENEHVPYRRRTVTIELTPEQREQLKPRSVGVRLGTDVTEEVLTCWLENEP